VTRLLSPTLLANRPGLRRALSSTGWLFADRAVRMGVGLFVGVWVARYLGPQGFGQLNYVVAFVGMFGITASLGVDNLVIRDIVRDPSRTDETLGTAFAMKLLGGVLAAALSITAGWAVNRDDKVVLTMLVILGSLPILGAFDTFDLYFQSTVNSKYTVLARNAAFLVFAGVKVALIRSGAPVVAFAWAQAGEIATAVALLGLLYRGRGPSPRGWRPSLARGRELLAESWPQVLTALAIMVYMKIDQIMLREMAGEREVGIYSAALRLSEVWYFVPMAVVASVFPSIVRVRETDRALYYRRLLRLFSLMAAISILIAIPIAGGSRVLITALFGQKYAESAPVLSVHIWSSLFVFWGIAQEPWNVAEGFLRLSLLRTVIGAVINVGLNFVLIPWYGSVGAAWATVVAYAFAGVFGNLLSRKTRHIFRLQLMSLLFPLYLFDRRPPAAAGAEPQSP
jgi:PST family polysaccharide transporter